MKKLVTLLALTYLIGWFGVLPAQAQNVDKAASIEQQLFNDFAVRMQDHLHKTAALLEKIRQSSDAQERQKLMKEYHQANQTTMKINHAMHMLIGGKSGMMGGKKMAAKGGGMGCMMMKKKSATADPGQGGGDTSASEEADTTEEAATGQKSEDSSEHEGHH